jgi:hypothetical protein
VSRGDETDRESTYEDRRSPHARENSPGYRTNASASATPLKKAWKSIPG